MKFISLFFEILLIEIPVFGTKRGIWESSCDGMLGFRGSHIPIIWRLFQIGLLLPIYKLPAYYKPDSESLDRKCIWCPLGINMKNLHASSRGIEDSVDFGLQLFSLLQTLSLKGVHLKLPLLRGSLWYVWDCIS